MSTANESTDYVSQLAMYAAQSMADGARARDVQAEFVQNGVPPTLAETIIEQVRRSQRSANRMFGVYTIALGIAIIIVALVLTGVAFLIAEAAGTRTFPVTVGAFFVGGIVILRGLYHVIVG